MGKLLKLAPKTEGTKEKLAAYEDFGHRVTYPETGLVNVEGEERKCALFALLHSQVSIFRTLQPSKRGKNCEPA